MPQSAREVVEKTMSHQSDSLMEQVQRQASDVTSTLTQTAQKSAQSCHQFLTQYRESLSRLKSFEDFVMLNVSLSGDPLLGIDKFIVANLFGLCSGHAAKKPRIYTSTLFGAACFVTGLMQYLNNSEASEKAYQNIQMKKKGNVKQSVKTHHPPTKSNSIRTWATASISGFLSGFLLGYYEFV